MGWLQSPTIVVAIVSIIGIFLSAIGSIIAVVWLLGNWKGTVETRLKPLEGFAEWKGTVDERLRAFEERLREFSGILEAFRRELFGKRTIQTKSPASLTDYGKKLSAFLRAKEWAVRTAAAVLSQVVNSAPFEIEAFSRAHVDADLEPEMTKRVAACAYEFGIEPDAVKSVLWVELRDELIRRAEQAQS